MACQDSRMAATGELQLDGSMTLYGSAQCTRDLSSYDCGKCLDGAISLLQSCCQRQEGARVSTESCSIRYEIYKFFNMTSNLIEAQIFMYSNCINSTNYISGSVYKQNLNLTLASLVANTSLIGFNVTSTGQNPDVVYGLVQCRGDISSQDCQTCVSTAAANIRLNSSNQKVASIGYDNCQIRYSNWRFFSTMDSYPRIVLLNKNNATEPVAFHRWLKNLVENLSSVAASDASRFAVGSTNYTDVDKLYALLQCTRDLSEKNCLSCLQDIFSYIPREYGTKIGCQIYSLSCNLRYETGQFFQSTVQLSSPETAPSPSVNSLLEPCAIEIVIRKKDLLLSGGSSAGRREFTVQF
ncbi:hypothetical protein L484_018281 [Morus notabilis]|uniref:Gnk2-homologous domain-containing protein n=1 Tax=Morus notabilis TaxID=981085 RepID=W9SAP1_9ROSA|nr:hypothetical protein L484_018281 [Morus notabilis]